MFTVILDNGHGSNTPGKCSPDRSLLEWEWNRDIVKRINLMLKEAGVRTHVLVPETLDVTLRERVRRVNNLCSQGECLLVSVHANASRCDGEWGNPKGWSVFVAPRSSAKSKDMARCLAYRAKMAELDVRMPYPNQPFWTQSLAMVRDTYCPAVLTENMFMDNKEDCAWMLTEEGRQVIAKIHYDAVLDYMRLHFSGVE